MPKKIVSKLRGKLVKMIKDVGSIDDYSISPKIRQMLLRWGYELTEKDFFLTQQIHVELLEQAKSQYKNLSKKEKIKEYQIKKYQLLIKYKNEALENK